MDRQKFARLASTQPHPRHFMQQAQYTICVYRPDKQWEYCAHEEVFKRGGDYQDLLRKHVLPHDLRTVFLERLHKMNITAYTLFANEDALMHTLALKEITLGPAC